MIMINNNKILNLIITINNNKYPIKLRNFKYKLTSNNNNKIILLKMLLVPKIYAIH